MYGAGCIHVCLVACLSLISQVAESEKDRVEEFFAVCSYVQGTYTEPSGFETLNSTLSALENSMAPGKPANRVMYLALPATAFIPVTEYLKNICMSKR